MGFTRFILLSPDGRNKSRRMVEYGSCHSPQTHCGQRHLYYGHYWHERRYHLLHSCVDGRTYECAASGNYVGWMRASGQAKRITATGHDMLKFNGYGNVSAETMPAKALWLKENEQETTTKPAMLWNVRIG